MYQVDCKQYNNYEYCKHTNKHFTHKQWLDSEITLAIQSSVIMQVTLIPTQKVVLIVKKNRVDT